MVGTELIDIPLDYGRVVVGICISLRQVSLGRPLQLALLWLSASPFLPSMWLEAKHPPHRQSSQKLREPSWTEFAKLFLGSQKGPVSSEAQSRETAAPPLRCILRWPSASARMREQHRLPQPQPVICHHTPRPRINNMFSFVFWGWRWGDPDICN